MNAGRFPASASLTAMLLLAGSALADSNGQSCDLLSRDELAAVGLRIHGKPQLQSVILRKGEQQAPTDIRSEVCFLPVEASGDRYGAYLSIDNFGEDISAETLDAWAQSLGSDLGGKETKYGNVTCETGSYDYTEANGGKRIGTQHYVACDGLRGRRRISLNFQAPDDKPPLPSPEAVRELIDKAWHRL